MMPSTTPNAIASSAVMYVSLFKYGILIVEKLINNTIINLPIHDSFDIFNILFGVVLI